MANGIAAPHWITAGAAGELVKVVDTHIADRAGLRTLAITGNV